MTQEEDAREAQAKAVLEAFRNWYLEVMYPSGYIIGGNVWRACEKTWFAALDHAEKKS